MSALTLKPCTILDGGLATHLEDQGYDLNHPLWSAHLLNVAPEAILRAHRDYLRAGADVITTATYQATESGFDAEGFPTGKFEQILRLAYELARLAVQQTSGNRPGAGWVAASIGPYGASLADGSEYRGDYSLTRSELVEFHQLRWILLQGCNPDVILCETIPSHVEVEALAELACQSEGPPVWISLSTRDEAHLADGTPLEECARIAKAGGRRVGGLGVNCLPPSRVAGAIEHLKKEWQGQLIAYPNSGETYSAETRSWTGIRDPQPLGQAAVRWFREGVSVIGGCCRTTPEHIRAIRRNLGLSMKPINS